MRLASVLVSSLNFTLYSHEKRKGTKQNGDKKWHQIWFSQNNEEKPYNFTKTNVQVSASPSSLHHLLYSYLTYLYLYLYLYLYVKKEKRD